MSLIKKYLETQKKTKKVSQIQMTLKANIKMKFPTIFTENPITITNSS